MKKMILAILCIALCAPLFTGAAEAKRIIVRLEKPPITWVDMANRRYWRNFGKSDREKAREQLEEKYDLEEVIYEGEGYWRCTPRAKILRDGYSRRLMIENRFRYEEYEIDNPDYGDPEKIIYIKLSELSATNGSPKIRVER